MKKSLSFWQFIGFLFTGLCGVLLHFAYDWSNKSVIIAPFSAVNESIFEHMKLLFFPMFIFAVAENFILKGDYKSFWTSKFVGITAGLVLIPVLYYSYTGIFGVSLDWVNIIIFFVAAAVSYLLETRLLKRGDKSRKFEGAALVILCVYAILFVLLTFAPPYIPLFEDPVTRRYGLT